MEDFVAMEDLHTSGDIEHSTDDFRESERLAKIDAVGHDLHQGGIVAGGKDLKVGGGPIVEEIASKIFMVGERFERGQLRFKTAAYI